MVEGSLTELFLPALVSGDRETALQLLAPDAVVDTPLEGRVPPSELARYVDGAVEWLASREAVLEAVCDTYGSSRVVSEWLMHVSGGAEGSVELPVATVGEEAGGRLTMVRMYHSLWPLRGEHGHREPLLRAGTALQPLPDVVRRYQDALREGDLDAILATFAPGGCAREPAGGPYRYAGQDELRGFYGRLLAGGGIGLDHCTVTDDGRATAIEYNVVRWGASPMPHTPGVAVYERDESGLLGAARIYDDAEPPGE